MPRPAVLSAHRLARQEACASGETRPDADAGGETLLEGIAVHARRRAWGRCRACTVHSTLKRHTLHCDYLPQRTPSGVTKRVAQPEGRARSDKTEGEVGGAQPAKPASTDGCLRLASSTARGQERLIYVHKRAGVPHRPVLAPSGCALPSPHSVLAAEAVTAAIPGGCPAYRVSAARDERSEIRVSFKPLLGRLRSSVRPMCFAYRRPSKKAAHVTR